MPRHLSLRRTSSRRTFVILAVVLVIAAAGLWRAVQSDDKPSGSDTDRGQIASVCGVPRSAISENPVASGEEYPTLYDNTAEVGITQPTEPLRFVQYKVTTNDYEFALSFGKVYSSGKARWVSCEGAASPVIDRHGEPVDLRR